MDDALIHINQVFAEAVFSNYKKKRYGLKNCSNNINADFADDIRNLYVRALEMVGCECSLQGCTVEQLRERINTL